MFGYGEHYIGQTGDTLKHRMTVHRQQLCEAKTQCTAVSGHLNNGAKNIFPNFIAYYLYKFYKATTEKECKIKEKQSSAVDNPLVFHRCNPSSSLVIDSGCMCKTMEVPQSDTRVFVGTLTSSHIIDSLAPTSVPTRDCVISC